MFAGDCTLVVEIHRDFAVRVGICIVSVGWDDPNTYFDTAESWGEKTIRLM